jgi:GxxExxY protein
MPSLPESELTHRVIGCAIDVHHFLGPGLLESIYEGCLCREFDKTGILYARQQRVPVKYRGEDIGCQFHLDLIVEHSLVLELEAVSQILPIHEAQLLTYLRISGLGLGLLLNFNEIRLKDGIRRRRL